MGLGNDIAGITGMRPHVAATILARANRDFSVPSLNICTHLIVAALRLGVIGFGHLPEAHIPKAIHAAVVFAEQDEQVLLLQLLVKFRIFEIADFEGVVVERWEREGFLGFSICAQTHRLGLDTCFFKFLDAGILTNAKNVPCYAGAQVFGFRKLKHVRKLRLG